MREGTPHVGHDAIQNSKTRLPVADVASARYGWSLRVIDNCGADPRIEQPEALLAALRDALDNC